MQGESLATVVQLPTHSHLLCHIVSLASKVLF